MGDYRQRRDAAPHLFHQQRQLGEPQAHAAVPLGSGHADQSGATQLLPQRGIEARLPVFVIRCEAPRVHLLREDSAGQCPHLLLLLIETKIHYHPLNDWRGASTGPRRI